MGLSPPEADGLIRYIKYEEVKGAPKNTPINPINDKSIDKKKVWDGLGVLMKII